MTPHAFMAKWLKSRARDAKAYRQHFRDLCEMFDHPLPSESSFSDKKFTFGYGSSDHGGGHRPKVGRNGLADVWKQEYFGWEYKSLHKSLDLAYDHLLKNREALENPPLLVVSDINQIEVHTHFEDSKSVVYEIPLEMLDTQKNLETLWSLFHDPNLLHRKMNSDSSIEESGIKGPATNLQSVPDTLEIERSTSEGPADLVQETSDVSVDEPSRVGRTKGKVSVNRFLKRLERSKLIEEVVLAELKKELRDYHVARESGSPPGKGPFSDSNRLAEYLIKQGLLSRWQCYQLRKGKAKGFFLGKYKLVSHLAIGGMGSVFLAEHTLIRHPVAIKVLSKKCVENASYIGRFHLEAKAGVSLAHPNIVRTYDAATQDDVHFMVMEYVEGRDLSKMVEEVGPFGTTAAAEVIAQAARGLQYAHDAGLIHRDIKPANILVDHRGVAKILDMGLARFSKKDRVLLKVQEEEFMIGTVDYQAPEQSVDSENIDGRADIYSLGCTLYFLLTGHPPFPHGTMAQRLLKHQIETPTRVERESPHCPEALANICHKMMEKECKDRFQNATEVAETLEQWIESRKQTLRPSGQSAPEKKPKKPDLEETSEHVDDGKIQTHGWDIDLVCSECGKVGLPVVESWLSDSSHEAENEAIVFGTATCSGCKHDLHQVRTDKLLKMFADIPAPTTVRNRFVVWLSVLIMTLCLALTGSMWFFVSIEQLIPPIILTAGLSAHLVGLVLLLVSYLKMSAKGCKCKCGKSDFVFMGILGGSHCLRCSSCGRLRRRWI